MTEEKSGIEAVRQRDRLVRALMSTGSNTVNERRERIRAVLERMLGEEIPEPKNLIDRIGREPFPDLEATELHEDYGVLCEKLNGLRMVADNIEALMRSLADLNRTALLSLAYEPDQQPVDRTKLSDPETLVQLAGPLYASHAALPKLYHKIKDRIVELESEKRANFNTGRGRKRNGRAHVIADRLARFFLECTGKKPTYGTSEYHQSSTDYQRALEEIFKINGIRTKANGPAKAACEAIRDEDINALKDRNKTLGALFAAGLTGSIPRSPLLYSETSDGSSRQKDDD